MRSSIATYRESLSHIANDLSDEDAASSFAGETPPSVGRRRRSLRTPPPPSPSLGSLIPNGSASDHDSYDEIARYKADIQKLQASEAEIKALSFNYAAMLKDKEEQLSKLRDENGTLKKSLEAKVSTPMSPRGERSALNITKNFPLVKSFIEEEQEEKDKNKKKKMSITVFHHLHCISPLYE